MKDVTHLLKEKAPHYSEKDRQNEHDRHQLEMVHLQQAMWMAKKKAVIVLEGFDAAGKGTCIRHLTGRLDPRSVSVVPIGPPSEEEKGQHYLQRFWKELPSPGIITVFDRSWYGRVLVEKVEKLTPKKRIHEAYHEINAFEKMLVDEGILLIKIFLVVGKDEQMDRFKARLKDPYKNWKITESDVEARRKWNKYVEASDEMVEKCQKAADWNLIRSDDKEYARLHALRIVTHDLKKIVKVPKKDGKKRMDKLTRELLTMKI